MAACRRPLVTATGAIVLFTVWHMLMLQPDISWLGDDTAQYLSHARNIVEGRAYGDTGYLFSELASEIGPESYPPTFPLLLAPIYARVGLRSFIPYKLLGLLLSAGALFLVAAWCERSSPRTPGWLVATLLAVNPVVTGHAVSIVSEPPFVLFAIATLYVVEQSELRQRVGTRRAVGAGLLLAAAWTTRSAGVTLLLALVLHAVLRRSISWRFVTVAGFVAVAATLVAGRLATGSWAGSDYSAALAGVNLRTSLRNARFYAGDFTAEAVVPMSSSLATWFALPIFVAVVAVGARAVWQVHRGPTIWECFVASYLGLILVWPPYQGTRFLLPVLPWAARMACIGVGDLVQPVRRPFARRVLTAAGVALGLLIYTPVLVDEAQRRGTPIPDGVSSAAVQALVRFVTADTPPDTVFVAGKPRALALFTGRLATALPRDVTGEERLSFLANSGGDRGGHYLVLDVEYWRDLTDAASLVDQHAALFEEVFRNRRFRVFRIRSTRLQAGAPKRGPPVHAPCTGGNGPTPCARFLDTVGVVDAAMTEKSLL